MSRLDLPALDPSTVAETRRCGYPEPFRSRVAERAKRRLGDACGLTKFGVNLVTLGVGGQSALRHWHTLEDEFIYVLAGEVVLIADGGEQRLGPGMCAGYPAGRRDAHQLVNRGGVPATYLEVGSRIEGDIAFYPDDDLMWCDAGEGEYGAHKDGRRYTD
ncbi:MAG: cupin domain-containing protein [Casimicrobiaceae bacterium]